MRFKQDTASMMNSRKQINVAIFILQVLLASSAFVSQMLLVARVMGNYRFTDHCIYGILNNLPSHVKKLPEIEKALKDGGLNQLVISKKNKLEPDSMVRSVENIISSKVIVTGESDYTSNETNFKQKRNVKIKSFSGSMSLTSNTSPRRSSTDNNDRRRSFSSPTGASGGPVERPSIAFSAHLFSEAIASRQIQEGSNEF
jgi:hypothetical protein